MKSSVPSGHQNQPTTKDLIVTDLVKIYPKVTERALDHINLAIEKGEIFGLLGPNGAGKTTAISIMSTTIQPTSGTVVVCNLNALESPSEVRKNIGLVPQDIALYPTLTARENLQFFGRMYGLSGSDLDLKIKDTLELVSLEDKADQRIDTYSGGMKRRANLAAGMLHRPRVLFLDEPTVGIDAQSRNMIIEKLLEMKESGMTMIYTTHYMEEAERLCNRVGIIDEGRIIATGHPHELIKKSPGWKNLGELFLALTGKRLRD
jgi:ABC-2 type transport system ATP-binding protein